MPPIRIDDPADPRVTPFMAIRERDLVGREGRFIAEGEVVLRMLLSPASRHPPEAVLVAEKRADALAGLAEAAGVPLYAASQAVMDEIAGFPIHRGILAVGRRGAEPGLDDILGEPGQGDVVLAVSGVGNHDNMGGLFRAAAAFGARAVLLDAGCCDPLYRKAIRVSVGAALITPFARLASAEAMAEALAGRGYEVLALTPSAEERLIDVRTSGPVALMVGSEGPGLAPALLARLRRVGIPMAEGFDSLNVATTAAIALHHLRFNR